MTKVTHISDAALERKLKRLMQRITETRDIETRRVMWSDYTELHRQRSVEAVRRMEQGWKHE